MNNIKDYRRDELSAYVIANMLLALLLHGLLTPEAIKASPLTALISSAIVSSIIYVYVFLLDSFVPAVWKDNLVYAFTGRPGDTIFSKIRKRDIDSRFRKEEAIKKYEEIYRKIDAALAKEDKRKIENSAWYSIYQKHRDKASIFISQRDFLLARDMSFMTITMAAVYVAASAFMNAYIPSWKCGIFLFVEFLLTNFAAKSKAKKFVLNVIASDIKARAK